MVDALTVMKALSVALAAGAGSLVLYEWRFYKHSFARPGFESLGPPDTARLLRRTVGSALLLTLAVLIFFGRLPESGAVSPEQAMRLFYYWTSILVLAFGLGVLALYDALVGMNKLRGYMTTVAGRDMIELAEQLKAAEIRDDRA